MNKILQVKYYAEKYYAQNCRQRDQAVDGGEKALCAQNDGVGSPRLRHTICCKYKYKIANTNTNTKNSIDICK